MQPAPGGSRRGGGDAPRGGEALGGAATRERHERRRRRLALPCSPPVGAVDVFDRRVARRGHGPERPRRRGRDGRVGPPRRPGPLRGGGGGCRGGGRRGGGGSTREGRRVDGGARRPRRSRLRVEPGRDDDGARAGAPAGPGGHGAGGRGGEERRTEGAHGFRHGYVRGLAQLHVFRLRGVARARDRSAGSQRVERVKPGSERPSANPLLAPQQVPLGVRGSLSGLFALLVPCLKEGGAQAAAAAGVLARVPPLAAPQIFSPPSRRCRRRSVPRRSTPAATGRARRSTGTAATWNFARTSRVSTSASPRAAPSPPSRRVPRAGTPSRSTSSSSSIPPCRTRGPPARRSSAPPTSSTGCCSPPPPPPPPRRRRSWPWRRTSWTRRFGPGSGRTFTLWGPRGRRRASGITAAAAAAGWDRRRRRTERTTCHPPSRRCWAPPGETTAAAATGA